MSKYRCGQCKSAGLYRDDDYEHGLFYLACRICGNRWPGGIKPIGCEIQDNSAGPSYGIECPHHETEYAKVEEEVDTERERGAIARGSVQENIPKVEEKKMSKRGTCSNCGRKDLIICNAEGMCHTCHNASKGLTGEEKIKALVAVKERLNDPNFKRGRPYPATKKPIPKKVKVQHQTKYQHYLALTDRGISCEDEPIIIPIVSDNDRKVYSFIQEQADKNRRTIPQQILWMIESDGGICCSEQ